MINLLLLPRAILQSWLILRRYQPDVVVGVGGYASGPVVLAAWLSGVPTVVQEQNAFPGLTNRPLGRWSPPPSPPSPPPPASSGTPRSTSSAIPSAAS